MLGKENKPFEYKVVRRKRKTVVISISHKDGVVITAPNWVTLKEIRELIDRKSRWIMEKLNLLEKEAANNRPKVFETGEVLTYLGENYLIRIAPKKGKVQLNGSLIEICFIKGVDPVQDKDKIRDKIEVWYKERAKEVFKERIEKFSAELGVKPQKLFVKEQKTRWGSCSSKGNINLNWRLIMAPLGIIDYVIVHELAHLRHMNHSKEFWATVESVLPDYGARRKWLKQNNLNLKF
ncbi:MAG TPA: SprT family zinc-dependent metalloprotease [Clostridia bacterium]|nr:SprT family zinc-dependent metalloprotease [Clostridia bacterium]